MLPLITKASKKVINTNEIKLIDVTVRDGLQSHPKTINVENKLKIIKLLSNSIGLKHLEIGSFVSPKIIPQMANSEEVFKQAYDYNPDINYHMLVTNSRGIEKIKELNVKNVAFFTSPSNSFNLKNINCNVDESLIRICELKDKLPPDVNTRLYLSCITECPFEGQILTYDIIRIIKMMDKLGFDDISLGDTLGTLKVNKLKFIFKCLNKDILKDKISIHLHQSDDSWKDIIDLCLEYDVRKFDTSILKLGGCPAAYENKVKSGNLDLYDLVNHLHQVGEDNNIAYINKSLIKDVEKAISFIL
tara:strand:+ start:2023 stop:2931 length:909 start_codon:yes stop_codon:yes gene_type:complete